MDSAWLICHLRKSMVSFHYSFSNILGLSPVGIITWGKSTIKLSGNKVRCPYNWKTLLNKATVQLLSCRKLREDKEAVSMGSCWQTPQYWAKTKKIIIILLNKYWFKLCHLASTSKLLFSKVSHNQNCQDPWVLSATERHLRTFSKWLTLIIIFLENMIFSYYRLLKSTIFTKNIYCV